MRAFLFVATEYAVMKFTGLLFQTRSSVDTPATVVKAWYAVVGDLLPGVVAIGVRSSAIRACFLRCGVPVGCAQLAQLLLRGTVPAPPPNKLQNSSTPIQQLDGLRVKSERAAATALPPLHGAAGLALRLLGDLLPDTGSFAAKREPHIMRVAKFSLSARIRREMSRGGTRNTAELNRIRIAYVNIALYTQTRVMDTSPQAWWQLCVEDKVISEAILTVCQVYDYTTANAMVSATPPPLPRSLARLMYTVLCDPNGYEQVVVSLIQSELKPYLPLRDVVSIALDYVLPHHIITKGAAEWPYLPLVYDMLCSQDHVRLLSDHDMAVTATAKYLYAVIRAIATSTDVIEQTQTQSSAGGSGSGSGTAATSSVGAGISYGLSALIGLDDTQRAVFQAVSATEDGAGKKSASHVKPTLLTLLLHNAGYRTPYPPLPKSHFLVGTSNAMKPVWDETAEIAQTLIAILMCVDRRTGQFRYRNWFIERYILTTDTTASADQKAAKAVGTRTQSQAVGFTPAHFERARSQTRSEYQSFVDRLQSIILEILRQIHPSPPIVKPPPPPSAAAVGEFKSAPPPNSDEKTTSKK